MPNPLNLRSSSRRLTRPRSLTFWMGGALACSVLLALGGQAAPDPARWQFEAERGQGQDGRSLPTRVGAAAAWVIADRAASSGRAVMMAGEGGAVGQVLPATVQPGTYTVRVRARGEAYQGWPTVELRLDGQRVASTTLESGTYAMRAFAPVTLRPGQRLEVVFVNDAHGGSRDKDRNAVLDRLDLTLVRAAASAPPTRPAPALASVASAPTARPASGDVLNVKTLGAKGDGVTDDTAALSKIGDAGGRDILFPPGTYLIRRPVRLSGLNDQTVSGAGATLRMSGDFESGDARGMLVITRSKGLTIRDLTLIGQPDYSRDPFDRRTDGLRVLNSQGVRIRGLNVQRTHSVGIDVDDSEDVVIEDSTVTEAYSNGIGTGNSKNVKVLRNTVTGLGDPARLKTAPGIGIFGWGGDTFLAEGNVLKNISDTATKTEGIPNTTYRNNTIDGFGKDGIKVMPRPGYSNSVSNAVIEGNTIRNRHPWKSDGTSYILFHSVLGGRIANNRIESTYRPGSFFEEDAIRVNTFGGGPGSRNIVIENNEALGTRRGVRLEADGVIFRGNTVRGSEPWARSGVIVSGNGVVVAKNVFDGPVIGVLLNGGAARTRVENNRFANHSDSAIFADNNNADTQVGGNAFGTGVARSVVGRVGACAMNRDGECQ